MGFFKMREPRKFNHKPIFYNPDKEALDERIEKVKREMGLTDETNFKSSIKGSFVDQTSHLKRKIDKDGEKSVRSRNIKLVVILVLLVIAFYYFYLR